MNILGGCDVVIVEVNDDCEEVEFIVLEVCKLVKEDSDLRYLEIVVLY